MLFIQRLLCLIVELLSTLAYIVITGLIIVVITELEGFAQPRRAVIQSINFPLVKLAHEVRKEMFICCS